MLGEFPQSPYYDTWWQLSAPFRQLFSEKLSYVSLAFIVLCALWVTIVAAFFGGAISRIATMQIAREEQIGMRPAVQYAWKKVPAYFTAPLLPLVGVLLVTAPLSILGLMMRLDVGLLLAGLLWPLVLIGGLLMGIFLLGLFFGWPLMWGAISTEGSDSFDALSRSYSYVYQRPYHYLFYSLVAGFLGVLGGLLAYYFAGAVIHLVFWAVSWGTGTGRSVALDHAAAWEWLIRHDRWLGRAIDWILDRPGAARRARFRLQLFLERLDDDLFAASVSRRRHGNGRGVPGRGERHARLAAARQRPIRRAGRSARRGSR